jgi:hypothetical protein
MTTFLEMVEAVQENNRINGGKWSDWSDCSHLEEVYGKIQDDLEKLSRTFLNALIRDGGDHNLACYMAAYDCVNYGYAFERTI